ncbi:MAG: SUMF1/EgtB/PvdO family nonheme iron enzyme [Candidatus Eisenbacteria sp.]|nr:SUMF1/EgtB/PvdO family nonheme iron enzyme [Candidatus Eisenbacteria bacterium]
MRIHSASVFIFLLGGFIYLLASGGCTEESPTADADQTPPSVAITSPRATDVYGARIVDSVDIKVEAADAAGIAQVEIWALFHGEDEEQRVATLTSPDTSGYYTHHWRIEGIDNGTTGVLYAIAVDAAGNRAASEKLRVLIINQSEVGPPRPDFIITPNEGTVDTQFEFDASVTDDDVESPIDILVRWDFENDGIWDIDTTARMTAADKITRRYAVPDTYTIKLEAYNSYHSIPNDDPGTVTKQLVVKPAEGIPRPPEYHSFIRIDPGTFPFGAQSCTTGDGCFEGDEDEVLEQQLYVHVSNPFYIDACEVKNEWYVNYLNAARDSGWVAFDLASEEVRLRENGRVLLVINKIYTRVKCQLVDTTFWVDQSFENHPVTGVTHYGATAYAGFYGMRLPTEVEWELAARGQIVRAGDFYPWSLDTVIDGSYANFRNSGDPFEAGGVEGSTTPCSTYIGTPEHGFPTLPAISPMGTMDQAGNVLEWVRDWYSATTYPALLAEYLRNPLRPKPPIDPMGPETGTERVLRGGSYFQYPWELRVTNRFAAPPYKKGNWIGFRTAYTEF